MCWLCYALKFWFSLAFKILLSFNKLKKFGFAFKNGLLEDSTRNLGFSFFVTFFISTNIMLVSYKKKKKKI